LSRLVGVVRAQFLIGFRVVEKRDCEQLSENDQRTQTLPKVRHEEAARYVSEINERTSPSSACDSKIIQLRLERNYSEAVRLLQARLAQLHFGSTFEKACAQEWLVELQFLAGDTAGLKVTAEAARNALEKLYRDQPDNADIAAYLSRVYAVMGKKDLALKEAECAVMLEPRAKDVVDGPAWEENLALIQTMFGENSRAISTLTQLLQTPYESLGSAGISAPITPALLRLDPIWDALRSDSGFQKLCEDKLDKSIAVLPFQNLSDDKSNAYFAEGIQDEILTRLSKIAALKVISRNSTQNYKSTPENLREVGQQLGVANLLEGSVQKIVNAVHVNVQLIRAATDEHLWAESYNRKLDDVFGVEGEVASAIADQLNAKLSGTEQKAIAEKPKKTPSLTRLISVA
jgi:TolB-like protein